MLLKPPTPQQLSLTFEKILTAIVAGELTGCPTDTGLPPDTIAALNHVATAANKTVAATEASAVFARTHRQESN